MLSIKRRGRSIFLADCVYVRRISKRLDISCAHLRRENIPGSAPTSERIVNDGLRRRLQDAFWKRFRLCKERPRPIGQCELRIGPVPYCPRWQDIDDGKPIDTIRMVKGHPIGDPTPTIMAGDREA